MTTTDGLPTAECNDRCAGEPCVHRPSCTTDPEAEVLSARTVHDVLRGDPWKRKPKRFGMTASSLGVCERKGAYLDAGVPFSEPDSDGHVTASMGNFLHDGLLPRLVRYLEATGQRAETEVTATWRPPDGAAEVRGRLDLATPTDVYDLKTYSEYAFARFIESGPKLWHRWQLFSYAEARRQAGHPCERVHVIGLERGTGDLHTWSMDYTSDLLEPVIEWLARVRYWAEHDPDGAQREQGGPGVSKECDWCPFLTRCWGPDAVEGEATVQGRPDDSSAIAAAAKMYLEASVLERRAKDDKKWARAILEGAPPGTYGEAVLKWRRGYSRKAMLDAGKAEELLRFAGLPVPMKDGADVAPVAIVSPAPEAPANG